MISLQQDIAGIVYTIYESIGKSVVVPHCGSKTINVRLTVSPDAKPKPAKPAPNTSSTTAKTPKKHRFKPRKLLKRADEDEDSGSVCTADGPSSQQALISSGQPKIHSNVYVTERQQLESKESSENRATCCMPAPDSEHVEMPASNESIPSSAAQRHQKFVQTAENIYESAPIVAPTAPAKCKADRIDLGSNNGDSCCRECQECRLPAAFPIDAHEMVGSGKPSVRRLIRKSRSRKQKESEAAHSRVRSLSVGNEVGFRSGRRRLGNSSDHRNGHSERNGEGSSGTSGKEPTDECLNNLRRNDLIDIIRESMEKNRLCFQSNG